MQPLRTQPDVALVGEDDQPVFTAESTATSNKVFGEKPDNKKRSTLERVRLQLVT